MQMEGMDLSIQIQKSVEEVVGVQKMFKNNYESSVFKLKETYEETDVKGNNNLLISSLKTDPNNDLDTEPSSLLQDETSENKKPKLVEESSHLDSSTLKRAIDLRIHNRTFEGNKRTIFEDAEYFSKNYSYKLLPITFDNVDESIIHSEHSYCYLSLNSESEDEEDCSRTIDYSRIKEKNYKKRKTKFKQGDSEDKSDEADITEEKAVKENIQNPTNEGDSFNSEPKNVNTSQTEQELVCPAQPLDLSTPLVQEKKTDHCLREHQISISNKNVDGNGNGSPEGRSELEKETLKSKVRCIEVTITRPDEKENYQPCDLFLNDIAKLVPRLIEKDCSEIDILDRTCDNYVDVRKHRLYYIISKSTWGLFQNANERVILTNDQSLGQPALRMEGNERPTFLVFDQFSLAKCLADYCKEIGGCFEYTCVEESENLLLQKEGKEESVKEKEINETEFHEVEEEQARDSAKNEAQIEFENVKVGEGENESVIIEGNLTESSCCNYVNANEVENGSIKDIPSGENEKVFVEIIEVNLNKGKSEGSKLEVEVESSELKEKSEKTTSFELTTCSTENKSAVEEEERVSSESEVNLTQKGESNTSANCEKEENESNNCLNAAENENSVVPNLEDSKKTKNRELDIKTIKSGAKRKRKQDFKKETKTDVKIKKPNVSRVTTRSKSTTAESKNKTAASSEVETSQNNDEPKVRSRRDLKRKDSVLESKVEIKKDIPKKRKRATSLEILMRATSSEMRTKSVKVKVEGKSDKGKKETKVLKQEQPGNAKRNQKRKAKKEQEGVVKTRKATKAENTRGLRSRSVTPRGNVNFDTVKIQKRDRKNRFTETRQKLKKRIIKFPPRSNR